MKLVSACLLGVNCKYNGGNNFRPQIAELVKKGHVIPVCPEQLGGLPTPRRPAEIVGGAGEDVVAGRARVITDRGEEVTPSFVRGAREVLELAKKAGVTEAILKERSPSCGCHAIYDGTFSRSVKLGKGVTAALLEKHGINVISEEGFTKGKD